MSTSARLSAVVALLLISLGPAVADDAPVRPLFSFDALAPARDAVPFPSNLFTQPDATQLTGRRVSLPLPDCAAQPRVCHDLRVINTLDGFALSPRISIPFSGAIDPRSVNAKTAFLLRLAPHPKSPKRLAITRIVWDGRLGKNTVHCHPEALLKQHTRYALIVTRGVRDAGGAPSGGGPKLHAKCGPGDTCGEGTCVTYYGIAGPRGPQFKTCEIKCDKTTKCPSGTTCTTVADGPGQVCH